MGTVISDHHLERIHNCIKETQGVVVAGGEPMTGTSELDGFDFSQGAFMPPTVVVDVPLDDGLWKEEVFGPVVVVKKFSVRILLHESMQIRLAYW